MNNADAALLRERNGHVGFSDGVHGGADDGDIEGDVSTDLGLGIGLRGNDIRAGGQEQHVIKGKSFGHREMNHKFSLAGNIYFREG